MYVVFTKEPKGFHVFADKTQCADFLGVNRKTISNWLEHTDYIDKGMYAIGRAETVQIKSNRGKKPQFSRRR